MKVLLTKYVITVPILINAPLILFLDWSVCLLTLKHLVSRPSVRLSLRSVSYIRCSYLLLLGPLVTFTVSLCLAGSSETDHFFATSGVEHAEHNQDRFRFHRVPFYSQLNSKIDNILTKVTVQRINLDIDGVPIDSRAHTHPSHSQTSRLVSYSLPSP